MLAERGERVKRAASANVGGNAFDKAQYRNGLSSEVWHHPMSGWDAGTQINVKRKKG